MTAEIAIMNKEAIALAADSAVTMTALKVFTSANKLFALSKYHPVGIMVYGNAVFMGVPWETIIKIYRNRLGKKRFKTLKEYAKDFIAFLGQLRGDGLFPSVVQDDYVRSSIYAYFNFIKDSITKRIHSTIDEKGEIADEAIRHTVSTIIREHYKIWQNAQIIPSIPKSHSRNILSKYEENIRKAIDEVFEKLPLSKRDLNQLKRIAANLFSKFPEGVQKEDISGSSLLVLEKATYSLR